ncbi:MAG: hypothetical protein ACRYFV_14775 [Janthinobacterium lividum]
MYTATPSTISHNYFKNTVGQLLAHPLGHYITVEYYNGPRQPADLLAFIAHAGQLLLRWGWDKLSSERGQMPPLSLVEEERLTTLWHAHAQPPATVLYGALLLPHDLFVRLSWRANTPSVISPVIE